MYFTHTQSDFTVGGKFVCMFLCIAGIALYSIPVGALFDAFGAVIGLAEEEEGEDTSEEEWCSGVETGGDQAQ